MADFWWWGYQYGHNLDPTAIIVVPDMTYQPPLIGTKQLLNFTASSWPAAGTFVAGVAFMCGVAALLWRRNASQVIACPAAAGQRMLASAAV